MAGNRKKKENYKSNLIKRNSSSFNKIQKLLSTYKKNSSVDFKGEKFSSVASSIYKQTKGVPLKQIENNIDVLVDTYFKEKFKQEEQLTGKSSELPIADYWHIENILTLLPIDSQVYINNNVYEGIQNYRGDVYGAFDASRPIINELNSYVRKNFSKEQRRSGMNVYVPIIRESEIEFKLTPTGKEFDSEIPPLEEKIEKPTAQKTLPKSKEEIQQLENENLKLKESIAKADIEKLKLEKEILKLKNKLKQKPKVTVKQQKEIQKTTDKKIKLAKEILKLKKAGFTTKEINKLLNKK